MALPTITIVIATFNSQNTLDRSLQSIKIQSYPQGLISIIIVDGGSKDKTVEIAKRYTKKIIYAPEDKQNAEYNKGLGVRKANGELLLLIDHDNILPHKEWLKKMTQPLLEHKEVVAVETLHYHYDTKASLIDRYFGLFGAGDPLAFYLGKADRMSYMEDSYNLYGEATDMGDYYIVKYNPKYIPTLGANGFLIRRKVLMENALVDEKNFFHIDVNVDLIRKGFNTYAFIKDDIIHLTGYKNIINFLKRRKLFMDQFHYQTMPNRRYSLFMKGDELQLIKFIIYAATFVKPTIDAGRGYLKIHDPAWFLHPVLCFILLLIYGYATIISLYESKKI